MRLEIPGEGDLFEGGPQPPGAVYNCNQPLVLPKHKNLSYIFLQILSGYHYYPKHKNKGIKVMEFP